MFTMLMIVSLLFSCEEEKEGMDLPVDTRKDLLTGGSTKTWLTVINESGMDECKKDNTLTFSKDGDLDYDIGDVVEGESCSDDGGLVGTWDFISDGDSLQFTWTAVKGEEPYDNYFIASSLIVKLTADTLIIRDDFGATGFVPN